MLEKRISKRTKAGPSKKAYGALERRPITVDERSSNPGRRKLIGNPSLRTGRGMKLVSSGILRHQNSSTNLKGREKPLQSQRNSEQKGEVGESSEGHFSGGMRS